MTRKSNCFVFFASFLLISITSFSQGIEIRQDGNPNVWTFHNPASSSELHLAPLNNGSWDWHSQTLFKSNGDVDFAPGKYLSIMPTQGTIPANWKRGSAGGIMFATNNSSNWAYGSRLINHDYGNGLGLSFDVLNNWQWSNDALFISGRNSSFGNIGLGTNNPTTKLQLSTNSFIGIPGSFGTNIPSDWQQGNGGIIFGGSNNSNWANGSRLVNLDCGDGMALKFEVLKDNVWTNDVLVISGRNGFVGNIGIGTSKPDSKLTVKGTIHATEIKVDIDIADYVFAPNYNLRSLSDVEHYIKVNSHLPGVPSAMEVKKTGLNMGEMQNILLEKVEELTLYLIEMKKENEKLTDRVQQLEKK